MGRTLAPSPARMGHRSRPPTKPSLERRNRRPHAQISPSLRTHMLSLPRQPPRGQRTEPRLHRRLRLRQRPPLRRHRCPTESHASTWHLPEPSRNRHRPRRLLQPPTQPQPGRTSSTRNRRPAPDLARTVPGPGQPPGHRPRPHLRKQRRSRRRLQPAPPLPDLFHQLRLQTHRDRNRSQLPAPRRHRPRPLPGHPFSRTNRRPPHPC